MDRGWNRILKEVKALNRQSIKCGIQTDAGVESHGAPIVLVAAWNEFGTSRAPARPAFRTMADTQRSRLVGVATAAYDQLLSGGSAFSTLSMVGTWYQDAQKDLLQTWSWVPNSSYTILKKGSDRPLVDTSMMVNSIRYVVQLGKSSSIT